MAGVGDLRVDHGLVGGASALAVALSDPGGSGMMSVLLALGIEPPAMFWGLVGAFCMLGTAGTQGLVRAVIALVTGAGASGALAPVVASWLQPRLGGAPLLVVLVPVSFILGAGAQRLVPAMANSLPGMWAAVVRGFKAFVASWAGGGGGGKNDPPSS